MLFRILSIGISLMLFVPSVYAEETHIDLDVAVGCYSSWKVSDVKADGIFFDFTFVRVREDEKWRPVYTVFLIDEKNDRKVIFQGFQNHDGIVEATVTKINEYENEDKKQEKLFVFELKQKYAVNIKWTSDNVILIVDGKSQRYYFKLKPNIIRISCSTAEILVENISLLDDIW
jgi:hypothetical protein